MFVPDENATDEEANETYLSYIFLFYLFLCFSDTQLSTINIQIKVKILYYIFRSKRPTHTTMVYYLVATYASSLGGIGTIVGSGTNLTLKGFLEKYAQIAHIYLRN